METSEQNYSSPQKYQSTEFIVLTSSSSVIKVGKQPLDFDAKFNIQMLIVLEILDLNISGDKFEFFQLESSFKST